MSLILKKYVRKTNIDGKSKMEFDIFKKNNKKITAISGNINNTGTIKIRKFKQVPIIKEPNKFTLNIHQIKDLMNIDKITHTKRSKSVNKEKKIKKKIVKSNGSKSVKKEKKLDYSKGSKIIKKEKKLVNTKGSKSIKKEKKIVNVKGSKSIKKEKKIVKSKGSKINKKSVKNNVEK